jgi:Subtilase family/GEVED domain/Secretion system C-terminal sorting domain
MPGKFNYVLAFLLSSISATTLFGQTKTNTVVLNRMSGDFQTKRFTEVTKALLLARQNGWPIRKYTVRGGVISLIGVDGLGNPKYVATSDNTIAAATTGTNQLWPGGSSGLNLTGSAASVNGKLGIWDGGHALTTHVELVGRIIVKDNSALSDHATHTSGTLIATGINPIAKGMAFQAQQLIAYDFDNDEATMALQAPNLLVSNHSYGFLPGTGWTYDGTNWDWYGDTTISKTTGYAFGYYSEDAQVYDSIAYNAPYYLINVAAGNPRAYNGPAVDSSYLYNGVVRLNRSAALLNNPTYTSISNTATAKNIMVVGAVNGIPSGYSGPSDVVMSDFSAWGPTNDGRVKPDIVADGVNVTSTWSTSNTAYSTQSGTSMATPNVTGSLYLIQQYYNQLHPATFMRAATLKGLAIHTADEAGPAEGPDYEFGWGLLDVLKAANVITSSYHQLTDTIIESALNGTTNTYSINVVASGKGSLVATMSWTDPPGTPVAVAQALNNTKSMLVNDLDMRITNGTQTFEPWILDPNNPGNAATTGDNFRDNVEKINVDSVTPGQTYTITITHKGTLARGQQAFSLLVSGIGGQPYCTSGPTSTAGTRIDSVNFSNVHNANPPGCTSYTNYTNLTAAIQPSQKLPISIKLSSCDGSTASKVVKVYIDYNNNGVFDPSEIVAQSPVLSGNVTFTDTIITPAGLTIGNYTTMRIVAEETTDPTTVLPCGTYGKGETEDYRIEVVGASNDVGVTQLLSPGGANGLTCANPAQLVTVNIKNYGSVPQVNVPVTTVISSGGTVVATFSTICPDTIPALGTVTFNFQSTFNSIAGNTYTFTSFTSLATDQQASNDTSITIIAINSTGDSAAGRAELCGSDSVHFSAIRSDTNDLAFWYDSLGGVNPIAIGNNASSSIITSDHKYYVGFNDQPVLNVGPPNKLVYPNGGYNDFSGNFVTFSNSVPLIIESARLYIGEAGTITFTVADISDLDTATGSYEYLPYSSTTLNVYPTTPDPMVAGTAVNSAEDTGAIYALNLAVPSSGNHAIIIDCENGADIFRNNMISANPYPLGIPGVFTITGNSALMTGEPTLYEKYYYFFYNLNLQLNNCAGPRSTVIAQSSAAPVISITGNLLKSTTAVSYQWYLNGILQANETRQTDTAYLSGQYTVEATDSIGCTQTSNQITYSSGAGSGAIQLLVSPNPNNGQFQLQFQTSTTDNVYVSLINTIGQKVYQASYPNFSGVFSQQINAQYLASDVYYLQVLVGKNSYIEKIVIR